MEALEAYVAEVEAVESAPLRIIGSGVGAYVGALYAARHPDAVDRIFLLSPAFKPRKALAALAGGDAGVAAWERDGERMLAGVAGASPYEWCVGSACTCTPRVVTNRVAHTHACSRTPHALLLAQERARK